MSLGRRGRERRPGSFFRGRELLGLALFICIAMVGFPIILSQTRRSAQPLPQVPKVAPDPRPIVPDDGPAFRAVRDKTPNQFREVAAYAELLKRVRDTTVEALRKASRRDLFFTHLWERPASYRGVPVHLEGTLLKLLSYEANPELTPGKTLYEAWFITPESRPFPYVIVFEDPPRGLQVGTDLNEPIFADGYFFKLLSYRAGDALRAAPLLIGRVTLPESTARAARAAAPPPAPSRWQNPATWAIAALLVYVAIRLAFQVRKLLTPRPTQKQEFELPPFPRSDAPSETDVTHFLQGLESGEATEPDE